MEAQCEDADEQRILDEGRALEPKCGVAASPAARSFKAGLRKMEHWVQAEHLRVYCAADFVNLVKCSLAIGMSADTTFGKGERKIGEFPVLCAAAGSGSVRCLQVLLAAGADVRLVGWDDVTALHSASSSGHAECVRLLLRAKAPLEAVGMERTALMFAAARGHAEVCQLLLSAGASARARTEAGREPLHYAAQGGSVAVMDLLLAAGADIDARDSVERTPLGEAAVSGSPIAAIRFLLDRGADPNAANCMGNTVLMETIFGNHPLALCELLSASDLSRTNQAGRNALHVCSANGNDEMLDLILLRVSDDVDARTLPSTAADGLTPSPVFAQTALHLSCNFGRHAMVKSLLRHGASRSAVTNQGTTPLLYAAACGNLSCVALLLGQPGAFRMTPAEINAGAVQGLTALHMVVVEGHTRVCGLLIQAGARLDATTLDGETPLMLAQKHQPNNAPLAGCWPATAPPRCLALPASTAPPFRIPRCCTAPVAGVCATAARAARRQTGRDMRPTARREMRRGGRGWG